MLLEEQVRWIKEDIDKSGIRLAGLKEDLLDHCCCFIEEEMRWGSTFQAAYAKAKHAVCPNGFVEIQSETIFLLNSKKIMNMKKAIYFIGLASAMSMSIGFLFRILHMPGADQLLNYGFFAFALLFLPLFSIFQFKNSFGKLVSERLKFLFGTGSALIAAIGILLKMQEMPDVGNVVLIIGILVFTFGYLPSLFFRMYKKAIE